MNKSAELKRSLHRMSLKAEKALKAAVAKVVEEHRKSGDPLAIWRGGKVVWVPATKTRRALRAS